MKLDKLNEDIMVHCAVMYAVGRQSYVVSTMQEIVRLWMREARPEDRSTMADRIEDRIRDCSMPERGVVCPDADSWHALVADLIGDRAP